MVAIYMHAVLFVADGRKPFDDSLAADMDVFIRQVVAYKGLQCEDVCLQPNHLHLLVKVPAQADVFAMLKILSYWLQDFVERNSSQVPFEWQERYWLVSKSPTDVEAMRKYFRRQPIYHALHGIEQEWEDMMDMEEIGAMQ